MFLLSRSFIPVVTGSMSTWLKTLACRLFVGLGLLLIVSPMASAQGCPSSTCTVATEAELQSAISTAISGDTIQFTSSITLTGNLAGISTDLTIDGGGFT